jgi:hypothetical protein
MENNIINLIARATLDSKLRWTRFSPKLWACSTRNVAINLELKPEFWYNLDRKLALEEGDKTEKGFNGLFPCLSVFRDGYSEDVPMTKEETIVLFKALKEADPTLLKPRPILSTLVEELKELVP